jgi:hypothetical protein
MEPLALHDADSLRMVSQKQKSVDGIGKLAAGDNEGVSTYMRLLRATEGRLTSCV